MGATATKFIYVQSYYVGHMPSTTLNFNTEWLLPLTSSDDQTVHFECKYFDSAEDLEAFTAKQMKRVAGAPKVHGERRVKSFSVTNPTTGIKEHIAAVHMMLYYALPNSDEDPEPAVLGRLAKRFYKSNRLTKKGNVPDLSPILTRKDVKLGKADEGCKMLSAALVYYYAGKHMVSSEYRLSRYNTNKFRAAAIGTGAVWGVAGTVAIAKSQ